MRMPAAITNPARAAGTSIADVSPMAALELPALDGRIAIVGSGPNGLAAAVSLARAGRRVTVVEAMPTIGGGTRTEALTLPGHRHDVCSTVHAMALASPFLRELPLAAHGLVWAHPEAPLAHPFDDGTAAVLERSTAATADTLDAVDRGAWGRLFDPLVSRWRELLDDVLAPPIHVPRHPVALATFGWSALRSATGLAASRFAGPRARALFAGIAGHALEPLDRSPTAAFGLMLGVAAHAVGWPFARGGSQQLAEALAAELRAHGGEIVVGRRIDDVRALAGADAALLDLPPRQVLRIASAELPGRYREQLRRFRYGPGVFKCDWVLDGEIPWRAEACRRAGTVHLGGTMEAILASSRDAFAGRAPEDPLVILTQPSHVDPTRAPAGRHVVWAYIHVPAGSAERYTELVERQVERFAPGFRDRVIARATRTAQELEAHNPNLVGGDIHGGSQDLRQLLFRPALRASPYATPVPGLFLCSSSTPPGGGAHGMCGRHAALAAERALRRGRRPLFR